jgi:cytochrome c
VPVGRAPVDGGTSPLGIGRTASAEEIEALGDVIFPDGTGLPAGGGTAASGELVFAARCAACHGPHGEGASGPALVHGDRVALGHRIGHVPPGAPPPAFADFYPFATTLFDYTRSGMPWNAPGSLSDDEVYAVVAYMLWLNRLLPRSTRLDRASLPRVTMPARARFAYTETGL